MDDSERGRHRREGRSRVLPGAPAAVVYLLREGPMRPGDLRAAIGGISQKMLTQTLRRMERMTLIERRRYAEAPPRVEYELTEAGRDLLLPIYAFGDWVDKHGRAVGEGLAGPDAEDDGNLASTSTHNDVA
ncbi:winged helix-turn-helix transcriptional regulator [Nocardia sp. CA-128927]|uniref:winged helix-turn-helix transcriptional regulator n=1 Tax=Nocardia sp. CA-128927 TaxID=3239975 RepID=UPI003D99E6A9